MTAPARSGTQVTFRPRQDVLELVRGAARHHGRSLNGELNLAAEAWGLAAQLAACDDLHPDVADRLAVDPGLPDRVRADLDAVYATGLHRPPPGDLLPRPEEAEAAEPTKRGPRR